MNDDFNLNDSEDFDDTSLDDSENFDDSDGNFNDANTEENGINKIIKWVIVGVVAFVVFLAVFFVVNALINGGKQEEVVEKDTPLTLNDEMVTYLYGNVSFAVRGMRNDIFFRNSKVTLDTFNNTDKFYFAFRYLTLSDFTPIYEEVEVGSSGTTTTTTETTTTDEYGNTSSSTVVDTDTSDDTTTIQKIKEYSIANDRIKVAMEDFFGRDVSYTYDIEVPIAMNVSINKKNAGNLKYDATSDSFIIKFDRTSDLSAEESPIKPYYGQVVSAIKLADSKNIVLKEKVIFTQSKITYEAKNEDEENKYDYTVCGDYACKVVLAEKKNVTKSQYYNDPIELDNYEDKATTITYTFFKDSNNEYHFLSSEKDK